VSAPLRVSVVGHVNTGKTSLIATLTRRSDLAIDDGRTTTHVQEITFRVGHEELLTLVDTPGFELLSEITATIERKRVSGAGQHDDVDAVEAFVAAARTEERPELALDVAALEAALAADVILYVVDVTQEPLERLRDEVALLVRTARPVVGILNFTAEPRNHTGAWREVFRREKVHAVVTFDVMVRSSAAEAELFRTMLTVVAEDRRGAVQRLERAQIGEDARRRIGATRAAAETLFDVMTLSASLPRTTADADAAALREVERQATERERRGIDGIARAHGFGGDQVEAAAIAASSELLAHGLFDPDSLRRHAPGLVTLMAGGAAIGGTIDVMVGGASLLLGALVGGAAGMIGGLLRRAIEVHRRGDVVTARPHRDLAWVLLARLRACHDAFRTRTHARRDTIALDAGDHDALRQLPGAKEAVQLLDRTRRDLDPAAPPSPRRRAEILGELEKDLARCFE